MFFTKKSITFLTIILLLVSVFSYIGTSISNMRAIEQNDGYVELTEIEELKEAGYAESLRSFFKKVVNFVKKVVNKIIEIIWSDPNPGTGGSGNRCNKAEYKSSSGYCMVTDASNGGYKDIGTQGHTTPWCLCYSLGYAYKMISNTSITTKTTNCYSYGTSYTASNRSTVFDVIRDQIIDNNKPVVVRLYNTKEIESASHYVLIKGIKETSVKKANSELNYSDFYLVDPVGKSSIASTKDNPIEKNWGTMITDKNGKNWSEGDNRTLQKKNDSYQYYLPKAVRK